MGSKFNLMRSRIIHTYSANMCAIRSVHAFYGIYNDANSKLFANSAKSRSTPLLSRTLSVSVRSLKAIIEGSYCLNRLAPSSVVRGHFPSIDGSDSVCIY